MPSKSPAQARLMAALVLPERSCDKCGREFTPARQGQGSPQIYCSAVCREAARDKKTLNRKQYAKNRAVRDQYCRNWRKSERLRLIADFGGKCVHCGEGDAIVLDFDHIHDDGHKDSRKNIIFRVKANPARFQLLCKNCNWKKEYWRRQNAERLQEAG